MQIKKNNLTSLIKNCDHNWGVMVFNATFKISVIVTAGRKKI